MRLAVVTGHRGGIGAAVVDRLKADGFRVVGLAPRVEDQAQVQGAWEYLQDAEVLVTCHGAPPAVSPTVDQEPSAFERVIAVDLVGTWRVCREAARHMIPRKYGRIVNLSSIHAFATYPERAAYAAAKAGVVGMSQALAIEWAPHGITVNCVLPGQVDSPRARVMGLPMDEILKRSPTGNIPTCADVADAVAFLCRRESGHINGHSLVVDGGWTKDVSW